MTTPNELLVFNELEQDYFDNFEETPRPVETKRDEINITPTRI